MDVTLYPDEEMWLCHWIGAMLRVHAPDGVAGVLVSNRIVTDANSQPVRPWSVGVHSDSGPDESPVTTVISVRFDVTGPADDTTGIRTARLAQVVAALVRGLPVFDPACPFAHVRAIYGPHDIPGVARPRFIVNAELVAVGTPYAV